MKKDDKKPEFLAALKDSLGIITSACEAVGISRRLYYNWMETDADFAQKAKDIKESQKDFVEGKLLEKINDGDTTAIIFYLKTICKDRGYTEKPMLEPSKKAKEGLTDDEQKRLVARIAGEKSALKKKLKSSGKYDAILEPQLDIVAELIVKRKALGEEMRGDSRRSVTTEISREGNERMVIDPRQSLYMELLKQEQNALSALGMDAKGVPEGGGDFLDEIMNHNKPQ